MPIPVTMPTVPYDPFETGEPDTHALIPSLLPLRTELHACTARIISPLRFAEYLATHRDYGWTAARLIPATGLWQIIIPDGSYGHWRPGHPPRWYATADELLDHHVDPSDALTVAVLERWGREAPEQAERYAVLIALTDQDRAARITQLRTTHTSQTVQS